MAAYGPLCAAPRENEKKNFHGKLQCNKFQVLKLRERFDFKHIIMGPLKRRENSMSEKTRKNKLENTRKFYIEIVVI
jgi:hypothetical protein